MLHARQHWLITEDTLTDSLGRICEQVEVARYRPNILIGGAGVEPFAEDTWQEVQLGPHRLSVDGAQPTHGHRIRLGSRRWSRVRQQAL